MKKILVIGATRGIGMAVVKRALGNGHSVRAFARSAMRMDMNNSRLERFEGDARSIDDLHRALPGIDAVVMSLGVPQNPSFIIKSVDLFSSTTRALLPAMREAGVMRLIAVTGFGAGDSRTAISFFQRLPFELIFGRAYADKTIQEQLIIDSGLDWTIVRPGVLTNFRGTGKYQVLCQPSTWRNGMISRVDVADFIVTQIDSRDLVHKAPVVIG